MARTIGSHPSADPVRDVRELGRLVAELQEAVTQLAKAMQVMVRSNESA
jgi:hypothetical protein